MDEYIKCNGCKILRLQSHYEIYKGVRRKTCLTCKENRKKHKQKNKCPCGKYKYRCGKCGGNQICKHDIRKEYCKECGGSGLCKHNKRIGRCKECGGSEYCKHNIYTSRCKECGGSSLCKHDIRKEYCKECGGSSLCKHDIRKDACKECGDEVLITFKNILKYSKSYDKTRDFYDEKNFIDLHFLYNLYDRSKHCIYCNIELKFITDDRNLLSIERIDNNIGHIKKNCCLSCLNCNIKRNNRYTHEEYINKNKL